MRPELEELAADLSRSGGDAWERLHQSVSSTLLVPWDGKTKKTVVGLRALAFDPNRETRRRAYETELAAWKSMETPFAFALNGVKGFFRYPERPARLPGHAGAFGPPSPDNAENLGYPHRGNAGGPAALPTLPQSEGPSSRSPAPRLLRSLRAPGEKAPALDLRRGRRLHRPPIRPFFLRTSGPSPAEPSTKAGSTPSRGRARSAGPTASACPSPRRAASSATGTARSARSRPWPTNSATLTITNS